MKDRVFRNVTIRLDNGELLRHRREDLRTRLRPNTASAAKTEVNAANSFFPLLFFKAAASRASMALFALAVELRE